MEGALVEKTAEECYWLADWLLWAQWSWGLKDVGQEGFKKKREIRVS